MTPGEVADVLKVHPATLTRWTERGLLKAIRLPGGRHKRYRRAEIDAILELAEEPVNIALTVDGAEASYDADEPIPYDLPTAVGL